MQDLRFARNSSLRRYIQSLTAFAVALVLFQAAPTTLADDLELSPESFIKEYMVNADRFQAAILSLQAEWDTEIPGETEFAKKMQAQERPVRDYCAADRFERFRVTFVKSKPWEEIFLAGKDFEAGLKRKGPNDHYVPDGNANQEPVRATIGFFKSKVIKAPIMVGDVSLPEIISEPSFRLTRLSKVKEDARDLIKVDFEYVETDPQKYITGVEGEFRVDSARSWAVTSFKVATKTKRDDLERIFYDSGVNIYDETIGLPIPVRIEWAARFKGKEEAVEQIHHLTKWLYEAPPLTIFDLKTYTTDLSL